MNGEILLDTNVLVYAYDRSEPQRQRQSWEILKYLVARGGGVVSTQVLSEFFAAITRKLPVPLTAAEGYEHLENYLQSWPIIQVTGQTVLEAARGARDHQMNFWDALIWATARLYQVPLVFSEDFQDGRVIDGVRFIDPFKPGFQLGG